MWDFSRLSSLAALKPPKYRPDGESTRTSGLPPVPCSSCCLMSRPARQANQRYYPEAKMPCRIAAHHLDLDLSSGVPDRGACRNLNVLQDCFKPPIRDVTSLPSFLFLRRWRGEEDGSLDGLIDQLLLCSPFPLSSATHCSPLSLLRCRSHACGA